MADICPGCNKPCKKKDFETKNILYGGNWWHRICQLKESGEYDQIWELFQMQDEWDICPEQAIGDLIAQIGHFCTAHNKGKRQARRINFEAAVNRGLRYFEEES